MKARPRWPAFAIPFVAALLLYLSTLAPTISWANHGADGGDLITAVAVNGVPHPPGYPAYVTLGQLFARLPLGSIAYRLNLMSAVCMALTTGLLGYTIARAFPTRSIFAPGAASVFFAAAPMVWGQAIIAEVHALNALFVAAILFLSPHFARGRNATIHLAALLWGLAYGNSITIAALSPLMLIAWWRAGARGRLLSCVAFLLGLSIYTLLPLRAALNPPINWGHAVTWSEFVAQVSAEMYRGYLFAVPWSEYPQRIAALAQLVVAQFGWLGVGLAALGMWQVMRQPHKHWLGGALSILLYVLFALSYNTVDSDLYLIPVWLFAAWPIAYGIWTITDGFAASVRRLSPLTSYLVTFVILFCGPILTVAANYSNLNLRGDLTAENFARAVLAQAPAEAILITHDDAQTFTLWYYRFVDGQRPDVAIVDARMAGYPWYEPMLKSQGRPINLPEYDPTGTWLERFSALNAGRRVCEIEAEMAVRCLPP